MKSCLLSLLLLCIAGFCYADLPYKPLRFSLATDQESYKEGDRVTFILTITNTDKDSSYPVLVPGGQEGAQDLYALSIYDIAENVLIERYRAVADEKALSKKERPVKLHWLAPGASTKVYLCWNDKPGGSPQIISHYRFGLPLFAGRYKAMVRYQPKGTKAGDSLYRFYSMVEDLPHSGSKLPLPVDGVPSNFCSLDIRKVPQGAFSIEGERYISVEKDQRSWYYRDSAGTGGTNERLVHISNLPAGAFASDDPGQDYYYNQFSILYPAAFNEYITRFANGNIREYRRFRNTCPTEQLSYRFDEAGKKVYYAERNADGRYYSISYDPEGRAQQETFTEADGSSGTITDYVYTKSKQRKKTRKVKPCEVTLLDGHSF